MGASVLQCLRRSTPLDGMDVPVSWSHNAGDGQVSVLRALDIQWKRWIHTLCARDTQHNSQQKRTDGYLTNHGSFAHHHDGRCRILCRKQKNFQQKMQVAKKKDRMQDTFIISVLTLSTILKCYLMQHDYSQCTMFCNCHDFFEGKFSGPAVYILDVKGQAICCVCVVRSFVREQINSK